MGDHKILQFEWRDVSIDIKVDMDKCTLLDVVVDFEDGAKKRGFRLNYSYPTFGYIYNMDHSKLEKNAYLITMFTRLKGKNCIVIWVGNTMKPSPLYKLAMNLRRRNEAKNTTGIHETVNECDDLPSLDDLEDTSVQPTASKAKPIPKSKTKPKTKTKISTSLPPPPISPNTAFKILTIRRSPRFSPPQNINLDSASANASGNASANANASDQTLFGRKVPKTTATRKGLSVDSGGSGRSARRKVDFKDNSGQ